MFGSKRGVIAIGVLVAGASLLLSGCASSSSLGGGSTPTAKTSVVVGSANFSENVILADIYGQALAANGFKVTYRLNIGARAAYIPALEKGEVNLIPEYSGSILDFLNKSATANSPADVKAALDKALPKGLTALTPSTAADSDSLNVTPAFAAANHLTSIADLKNLKSFTLAANPEFQTRPDGIKGLESVYGLNNIKFKSISDGGGPATLKALLDNTVQVADIYSTTPSIAANKLVTLTDPKSLFASQEVVPIVSTSKVNAKLTDVLNKVSAKLTTADLQELNNEVSGTTKTDPATAAKNWLSKAALF
ncbi:MAG: osmoprotectant transport system substrate-binding protein [Actinomycetota bacterium]|jgi:osmoprotectant transport system substrate-binding protein|nr:glycine/betaine transporter [Glaciihabitans sp.]MDQ1544747.1 osmoprotectant transport system substrate-binding protein [Actinomycetota bacterium]